MPKRFTLETLFKDESPAESGGTRNILSLAGDDATQLNVRLYGPAPRQLQVIVAVTEPFQKRFISTLPIIQPSRWNQCVSFASPAPSTR